MPKRPLPERRRLTDDEIAERLATTPGWTRVEETITRTVKLKDFSAAFAFMTRVALAAEQLDHHPDWSNSWSTVVISLHTHSEGGLTDYDFELARRIDGFLGE